MFAHFLKECAADRFAPQCQDGSSKSEKVEYVNILAAGKGLSNAFIEGGLLVAPWFMSDKEDISYLALPTFAEGPLDIGKSEDSIFHLDGQEDLAFRIGTLQVRGLTSSLVANVDCGSRDCRVDPKMSTDGVKDCAADCQTPVTS